MFDEFNIFNIRIEAYGLMIAIGVLFLAAIMVIMYRRNKVSEYTIDYIFIITAISGLVLYFSAGFFNDLWNYLESGTWEWDTGITFAGGLVGGILTYLILFWVIMKKQRHNIFKYLDVIITGVVLCHAWGRIGCYCGGCCYGAPTSSMFGVLFPGIHHHVIPTNLIESGFLFLLFIVLFFFIKKNQLRYYLVSYGVFRFALEYLRGDDRGASPIPGLSPSQFLCAIMIICGILLFIWGDKLTAWIERKYTKKENIKIDSDLPLTN